MLKFLIIIFVFFFILIKLGGFLLRIMIGRAAQHANRQQTQYKRQANRKPSDGNVNIDYIPKDKKSSSSSGVNGGDYVDFEEVKD